MSCAIAFPLFARWSSVRSVLTLTPGKVLGQFPECTHHCRIQEDRPCH
jgi:hypothetical protein